MDFFSLFLQFLLHGGFFFSVVGCAGLAAWGIWNGSGRALWLSAALLLPSAFFLSLEPILAYVDELPGWLARNTLWTSILLAPLVAVIGVWKRSRLILLMSSALSVPMGVYFFFYPGTRVYLALPIAHLTAALWVRSRVWWVSWVMLVLIGLFLVRFGGLIW